MDLAIDRKVDVLSSQGGAYQSQQSSGSSASFQPWTALASTAGVPFLASQSAQTGTTTNSTSWPLPGSTPGRLDTGPSPEKGSGQDRFRQMMMTPTSHSMDIGETFDQGIKVEFATGTTTPKPPPAQPPSHYSPDYSTVRRPSTYAQTPAAGNRPSTQGSHRGRAGTVPATARKASGNNASNVSNGRRRASGPDGGDKCQTQTALLSAECQKRRFNPQFREWSANGQYYCSVNLNGIVLNNSQGYSTANEAKQALARRAVAEIRKIPCTSPAAGAAAKVARAERQSNEVNTGGHRSADTGMWATKPDEQNSAFRNEGGHTGFLPVSTTSRVVQANACSQALPQTPAPANTLSPHILSNPIASQAFLEGLALGARLYESAQRLKVAMVPPRSSTGTQASTRSHLGRDRERERSPFTETSRQTRERSPLRSQHREV
ncbi:hypothetical protein Micbo1qcDRAFT_192961 [Microdochium bolleyi]|uniref:Uncharacterized protein n=1 Tax=Microdochium bolleyi TaxID=196109 RepID=A0A136JG31_9PEZI|nr:hypothetical protein Micbo1qcDRAFT_192961 [Microdochium bolleyi]